MDRAIRQERSGCGGCPLSRRAFLAGCAACATGAAVGLTSIQGAAAAPAAPGGKPAKSRVRLVFSHTPSTRPMWPNIGYDFEPPKKRITQQLAQLSPNIEFLPVTLQNADQARKLLDEDKGNEIDGYLVVLMSTWVGVPQAIAASGKPTIFADDLFAGSGEFLIAYSAARRQKQAVGGVSSSRIEDLADAVRCFEILKQPGGTPQAFVEAVLASRKKNTKPAGELVCTPDPVQAVDPAECLARLRKCTILAVGGGWGATAEAIQQVFGTKVLRLEFKDLNHCYEKVDRAEARRWADRWMQEAEKVIEPSRQTIEQSAAMYLAMKDLLAKHKAQAIAVNCLGGFYGGHLAAYPCLGYCQMNSDGSFVGACEADLTSTITMLVLTNLVGRPGYISDPVIDTSKNEIIYAHCVAPFKVFGPAGPSNPFHIRNHSEDRKGASIRSLMPLGYMTTTVEFHPNRREVIFHQGKSVENVDEDKACRTKLAVEVKGDIDKLLREWDQWGWHRVTAYGDLREPVFALAKALGMKVIEEA